MDFSNADPHAGAPVLAAGAPLNEARCAVVMIHGRGATAADILELARQLPAEGVAYLAPQAEGNTWYPHRFLEPIGRNEPALSSALAMLTGLAGRIREAGTPGERIAVLGFSQGACLALEWALRNPGRHGGVIGLSGGLIGPPGTVWPAGGGLDGTRVFLGCGDEDAHIPADRVIATAERFRAAGAEVDLRLYPGMGHTVNRDEIGAARAIVETMLERGAAAPGRAGGT